MLNNVESCSNKYERGTKKNKAAVAIIKLFSSSKIFLIFEFNNERNKSPIIKVFSITFPLMKILFNCLSILCWVLSISILLIHSFRFSSHLYPFLFFIMKLLFCCSIKKKIFARDCLVGKY